VADAVKKVSKQDVAEFYKTVVAPDSLLRRKMAVHVVSSLGSEEAPVDPGNDVPATPPKRQVTDAVAFKSQQYLAPLPPVPDHFPTFQRDAAKGVP